VVLYSMSDVNMKKFAQLASGLSSGFGAQSVAFQGQTGPMDGSGNSAEIVAIDPGANPGDGKAGSSNLTAQQKEAVKAAMAAEDRKKASQNAQAAGKEAENLKKIENKISDALAAQKLLGSVRFTVDRRGLVVTVLTNEVVFAGNRADLQAGGKKILDAIAPSLVKLPNNIEVDGNTNQLKVKTSFYPSGWELSAARASTTVRYLGDHGIAKNRMSAVGFSDTKPLISPSDPRSITMNRRVDIVVLTTLTADQAALLPAAAGADNKLHPGQTSAAAKAAQQSGTTTDKSNESGTEPNNNTPTHD
jgi:chemotaxis protein MotB